MGEYFAEGTDEWSGEPLNKQYEYVLRILRKTPAKSDQKHPILRGCFSLSDVIAPPEVDAFLSTLYWDQGEPEADLYLPPIMMHGQRRGPSQPPSDFFLIPFHIVRFEASGMFDQWQWGKHSYFSDLAVKTLKLLEIRTVLARKLVRAGEFTVDQAAAQLNVDFCDTQLILGQMIRVGLVEFDRISGLPWNHEEQMYVCTKDVEFIS